MQNTQLTSKKKTQWLLIALVVLLLGTTGTFSYKYYRLKQQTESQQSISFTGPTTLPSYKKSDELDSQQNPYQTEKTITQVNQDEDWGFVTVKEVDNEIDTAKTVKYSINSPIQINKVMSYNRLSSCPDVSYQVADNNQDYHLSLFLGHVGLPPYTEKTTDDIVSNGKQFKREKHFREGVLTAVFYRSNPLTITASNGRALEYTWMAYFYEKTGGDINKNILSKVETILGSIEIIEINLEKTPCELRVENLSREK